MALLSIETLRELRMQPCQPMPVVAMSAAASALTLILRNHMQNLAYCMYLTSAATKIGPSQDMAGFSHWSDRSSQQAPPFAFFATEWGDILQQLWRRDSMAREAAPHFSLTPPFDGRDVTRI
jgi:hypothetical protein